MNIRSYASVSVLIALLSMGPLALSAERRGVPVTPAAVPLPTGLTVEMLDRMTRFPGDLGVLPVNNLPISPAQRLKIELGRKLFFDTRLSIDRAQSCATCHDPKKAYGDAQPLATGFKGVTLRRHTPTLLNAALGSALFWDGRADGLEAQAVMPMMAAGEMNMGSEANILQRLRERPDYDPLFQQIYGSSPNLKLLGDAIAAFEATLMTPDSPFDRYVRGDRNALTLQQRRGLALLVGKAACVQCHSGPNFTDGEFYNIGLRTVAGGATDFGRFDVTRSERDRGAFKTPTLRNVAITGPYMHDGSIATLEEVIDHYARGGDDVPGKSDLVFALGLTKQEKLDLIAFLQALTGTFPPDGQAAKSTGGDQ
jgi:cytochrome c peroxidase